MFESGAQDISLPPKVAALLVNACRRGASGGSGAAACDAALSSTLRSGGEGWRQAPLAAYEKRLHTLLEAWSRCRQTKPHWRGIFQLAVAPRPPRDCKALQLVSGFASDAHRVNEANSLAKRMVEAAGFEVFDPFGITLHADPRWYDGSGGSGGPHDAQSQMEATSDVLTQMLISTVLCASAKTSLL